MREIAPGVYVEDRYFGVTVACIVTDSGVICVDSPMLPEDARQWRSQIASVSDRPVKFVILTDANRDRVLGLQYLGGAVVAHETAWEKIKTYGDAFRQQAADALAQRHPAAAAEIAGSLRIPVPEITFTQVLTLYKGDSSILIRHIGGAAPGSVWAYLPEQSILFTGDLMTHNAHPVTAEADIPVWLDALARIQHKDVVIKMIVPGRGSSCTKAAVEPLADYLRAMRSRVQALVRSRRPRTDTTQLVAEFLDRYPVPEDQRECVQRRIKAGLDHLYDTLKTKK